MRDARRYGPLVAWFIAFVIVRTAIQDHRHRWTWILVGLLVLYGAGAVLNDWRGSPAESRRKTFSEHAGAQVHKTAPSQPNAIGFQRGMLVAMGALGVVLSAVSVWGALIAFRDLAQSYWLGGIVGAFMVFAFALFSWWVVFAVRGLLGRPALILDANGLTDQSSPVPLGRIAWNDIEAIHWQWPGTPLATRPVVAVERHAGHGSRSSVRQSLRNILRSRGLDPAKLAISIEELAHEFRRYSGGRFGIRQR